MTNAPQQPPAGWYPDPAGSGGERFWDGVAWSQSTRDKAAPPAPDMMQSQPPAAGPAGYGSPSSYGTPSAGQQYGQQQYGQQPSPQQQYQPQYDGYGGGYGGYAPQGPRLAGFWWRLLGYFIDGLVLMIPIWIVGSVTGVTARFSAIFERWITELLIAAENPSAPVPELSPEFNTIAFQMSVIQVVVWALYRVGMYAWKSATVGMLAVGARLVPAADQNAKLSWGTIIIRSIVSPVLYALSLLGFVNGVAAAVTKRKQTLADMISRTLVLKIR